MDEFELWQEACSSYADVIEENYLKGLRRKLYGDDYGS